MINLLGEIRGFVTFEEGRFFVEDDEYIHIAMVSASVASVGQRGCFTIVFFITSFLSHFITFMV